MTRNARNLIAAAACLFSLGGLASPANAAPSGSDEAFDQLIGAMASRDTGSQWFDGYVDQVNQQIALKNRTDAYGAAGPNGPLDGFNGYVSGFRAADSGSARFDNYVDAVNRLIQIKQQY